MNCDKELIEEFVIESREHLADMEDDLLRLERSGGEPSSAAVDKVFRAIHSIKGAAGFLGLRKINDLSHVMETVLQTVRSGEAKTDSKTVDALLAGVDLLNSMLERVDNCDSIDIQKVHDRLSSLLAKQVSSEVRKDMRTSIRMLDMTGAPAGFSVSALALKNRPKNHEFLYILRYDLQEMQRKGGFSPLKLVKELLSTGEIVQARISSGAKSLADDLSRMPLDYEVLYSTVLGSDLICEGAHLPESKITMVKPEDPAFQGARPEAKAAKAELEGKAAKEAKEPSEAKSEEAAAPSPSENDEKEEPRERRALEQKQGKEGQETLRISVSMLDRLMTLAGELVLVRNQHLMRFSDLADSQARGITQRLNLVTSELQETIMRARMQPVGNVFGKLPRIARDLSQKLGKKIELHSSGEEVELDKAILEALADPMTHIIRNCCDHGIETPAKREAAGKPATGNVFVKASHDGGQISIEIRDDGQGIDWDRVKAKAVEHGLATAAQVAKMDERELAGLLTRPGFSTAEKVTDISGRGVGMDVVKSAIEKLGGSLEISSERGVGTRMEMRLPLTLAIIPCLIVSSGGERFALPQVDVEELVCLYDADIAKRIEREDKQEVCLLRNKILPLVRLSEVLARQKPFSEAVKAEISELHRAECEKLEAQGELKGSLAFAVARAGGNRFGLAIDKVLGTEEIVVKPMHSALKSIGIYSGATVMGDGQCALILDLEGVAAHAGLKFDAKSDAKQDEKPRQDAARKDETQTVLLFASGPDEQFAMPLQLIKRIERFKRSRLEKVGDKEFLSIDGTPTRVVRLDKALSVSPCVELDEMYLLLPKHGSKPFGLLISSLVDIMKSPQELNAEGHFEDGVLGSAVLRERITIYPDIYRLVEKIDPDWFRERKLETPPPGGKRRILLVEDAVFFRQLVKAYLESDGYSVETATDGRKALEKLGENGAFDLIVSDIEMPVMNGWELAKALKADKRLASIPIIALTALDDKKDVERAKSCGFEKYQVKIDREALLKTVAESLSATVAAKRDAKG